MKERFGHALTTYLKARLSGLGAAVRPSGFPPKDVAPMVAWRVANYVPVRQHDERDGKRGHTAAYRATAELVVWDTDSVRRDRVTDKIVGTHTDPGLLGWREWFPAANDPNRLAVQSCEFPGGDDGPEDDMEPPPDGTESRWYSTTITLDFFYAAE